MSKLERGILICFEGTEGSGKSTLIRHVSSQLSKLGQEAIQTREPGGSSLAEKIRAILLHEEMHPVTELMLYEAARAEHLATTIVPAMDRGQIVLCDRFTASTLAYQSYARGLPWKDVKRLNQIATQRIEPDGTVLLDIDPEKGLRRAQDPNRFEAEGLAFQKKVRAGYLKARSENPSRWLTLKIKNESPDELAGLVVQWLQKKFKKKLKS